jgi:hypothetical protein
VVVTSNLNLFKNRYICSFEKTRLRKSKRCWNMYIFYVKVKVRSFLDCILSFHIFKIIILCSFVCSLVDLRFNRVRYQVKTLVGFYFFHPVKINFFFVWIFESYNLLLCRLVLFASITEFTYS